MNTLSVLAAFGSASILLSSCGGEPLDYSKNTEKSVFIWRDGAWAEHPGVAMEGAPGTPKSARKALVGKIFRVAYTLDGQDYTFYVTFTSQVRCSVRTNARLVVPDGTTEATEYSDATYTYKIDNNNGTEATLTVSFDSAAASNQCTLKLIYRDAFNATTTFMQFRNGNGITVVPAGTRATEGTWQVLEGI